MKVKCVNLLKVRDGALAILSLVLVMLFGTFGIACQDENESNRNDLKRVNESADRFIEKFHETLDFGIAFDEVGVSDPGPMLRKTKFFENFQINGSLVNSLSDSELKRLYKVIMSAYYVGDVYNRSVEQQDGCQADDGVKLPPDVEALLNQSRFAYLQNDASTSQRPLINTARDLEEYVALSINLTGLLRNHLPKDVFNTSLYKRNVANLNKQRGAKITVRDGDRDFGIPKGSNVYETTRDLFTMFLVEENGEMKVLTFGIGN